VGTIHDASFSAERKEDESENERAEAASSTPIIGASFLYISAPHTDHMACIAPPLSHVLGHQS
jgi:hypothetical protein